MLNTTFFIYIFSFHEESLLLFSWVSSLIVYFIQKHNTKNANWKLIATKNIVIVNTNQIKLNTYPDFLKENNLSLKGYY